jgi:mitochondrial fission protein ELM1
MFSKILIGLIALIPFMAIAAPLEVISIYNEGRIGDQSQVKGIKESLSKKFGGNIDVVEFKDTQLEEIRSYLKENNKYKVIIASGESGVKLYDSLKGSIDPKNTLATYSSHMPVKGYEKMLGTVKLWALPKHVVNAKFNILDKSDNLKGTKIVPVIGVPHNVTQEELRAEYTKYKDHFKNVKGDFVVVILGGDAPDEDGKMRFYHNSEAMKLANVISTFANHKNLSVLVFNGPRTGLHDDNGKVDDNAHRTKLDHVTNKFQEIITQNVPSDRLFIYDFKHGEPSLYKAGLGFALEKHAEVFVPGESTSMISEAVDNLSADEVIIVSNDAMNKTHEAHVRSVLDTGHAKLYNYSDKDIDRKSHKPNNNHVTAADVFAGEIYKEVNKTFKIK